MLYHFNWEDFTEIAENRYMEDGNLLHILSYESRIYSLRADGVCDKYLSRSCARS